jgi:hypothetical protein
MRFVEELPPNAVREATPERNRIAASVCRDLARIQVRGYLGSRLGSGDPPQPQTVMSMLLRVGIANGYGFLDRGRPVFAHRGILVLGVDGH